ncbi:tetratricopeptide repeat protein [Granulicella cerasi]|uniref:Tetratricopeptide repeat protein n=1 Tax=Granulicella cerasi TaxID=741063 RepID=A0ABW1ZDC4_9BACT|nr:tetratricopeptide repeat protein [Granulicella cerasi]
MATKSATTKSTTPKAEVKPKRASKTIAGDVVNDDAARKSILALYESALKLMQAGKYDKAHAAFDEMLAEAPQDLGDRIRMYIAACVAQISKGSTEFSTHEERYDYAISLLNQGHYEDAREHFNEIILKDKEADYAFYGLALLASLTGETSHCIEHLTEAIRLNAQNRFQARSDSDFEPVADDPRFTELLYPEA